MSALELKEIGLHLSIEVGTSSLEDGDTLEKVLLNIFS